VETPISDLSDESWDLHQFFGELHSRGLAGVCNGMTVGYLAGLIVPTSEGSPGMSERRLAMAQRLKFFIDTVTHAWHQKIVSDGLDGAYRGEVVTQALLAWLRASTTRMDDVMAPGGGELVEEFWAYFEGAFLPDRQAQEEQGLAPASETTEGLLATLGLGALRSTFDGIFGAPSELPPEFSAIVAINAWRVHETGQTVGGRDYDYGQTNHEFAVRFDPERGTLSIFDQTRGLRTTIVKSAEQAVLALIDHLTKCYIQQPMRVQSVPTNYGRFTVDVL